MTQHTKEPWDVLDGMRISATYYDDVGGSYLSECVALTNELVNGGSQVAVDNARRIVACVNACVGIDTAKLESDYKEGFDPWSYIKYLKAKNEILQDAIDEIALAGMSAPLSMAMQEDEVQAWHARRAWEFIQIAAIAKTKHVEVQDD